jgi:beta-glucanase (GH16 family)
MPAPARMLACLTLLGCLTSCAATTTAPTTAPTTASAPADGYKLVWSDEFNTDGPLNPADWNFERGFVRNNELQWYQPENANCAGGFLVIEARRETKPNPRHKPDSKNWRERRPSIEYTAASAITRGKREWQYGRFEIRAKIDTRPGSWPAFWMLGAKGGWPAGGEVDIMEYYRGTILANLVWARTGGNGQQWNTGKKPLSHFPADWPEQFHTWRMDWDEKSIELYCDDQLLNRQDLSQTINPDGTNPFHAPAYLLLNQAIGGDNGGDPSKTEFPVRFTVDYVRVYQKAE